MAEGIPKVTRHAPELLAKDVPKNRTVFKDTNITSSMEDAALHVFRKEKLSSQEKREFRDWNVR